VEGQSLFVGRTVWRFLLPDPSVCFREKNNHNASRRQASFCPWPCIAASTKKKIIAVTTMAIDDNKLDHWFGRVDLSALTEDQNKKIERIRASCKLAAESILRNTEGCADQSSAIREVRNAMSTAVNLVIRGKQ
jgi:hypothetical protein